MLNSFFIRHDGKFQAISFDEIDYIESRKNYVCIATSTKRYVPHLTMKQVERKLPNNLFCRIHRSCIVSLNKIEGFDCEFVYLQKTRLPLSARYAEILKSRVLIVGNDIKDTKHSEYTNLPVCGE